MILNSDYQRVIVNGTEIPNEIRFDWSSSKCVVTILGDINDYKQWEAKINKVFELELNSPGFITWPTSKLYDVEYVVEVNDVSRVVLYFKVV